MARHLTAQLDHDLLPDLVRELNIIALPSLIMFRRGQRVDGCVASKPVRSVNLHRSRALPLLIDTLGSAGLHPELHPHAP